MMQQPTGYANPLVAQNAPGNRARRLTYALLIILIIALMAGGLYWVQWTAQRGVTLGYPKPKVILSPLASNTLRLGDLADFSASATGRGLTYSWDFGDSTSAVGANVSHSFQSNGTFNVTVTVTDALGQTSSASTAVKVYPPPPVATFTPYYYGYGEFYFDASGSSADPSTQIDNYLWDFGDGTGQQNGNQEQSYTYNNYGTYTVTLIVVDGMGQQSDPFSVTVTAD
jgi:PKD repeat protein